MQAPQTAEDCDLILAQSMDALNDTDEPLINGISEDEHEEFMRRRSRSPEEQAEFITSLMQRNGTARLPGRAKAELVQSEHRTVSQLGQDLRRRQVDREREAAHFLSELGPWGIAELITELGMGGVIKKYNLSPLVFKEWCERMLGRDQIEECEHLYAERMLYDVSERIDRAPADKVEADYLNHYSKTKIEIAGLFNRKRARAAPKIDVQQVAAKAVEVNIQVGGSGALAADKARAERQVRLAKARVNYGTSTYVDPPGLRDWVDGLIHIPDESIEPYLMLEWVPEQFDNVIDGQMVDTVSDEAVGTPQDEDPTVGMDEPVPTFNPSASGLEIPDELFD